MKKRITAILLAGSLLGVGGGMFAAHAEGTCAGPVSVDCDQVDANGNVIAHCTVYVSTDATGELCINAPA